VCGIENLSKESLINMFKEIEKDYLETIEKEPKIEIGWPPKYVDLMFIRWDKFYSDLEKKFPTEFDKKQPLENIKEYVKQNFPNLKIAKGFTEKQQQKEFFGPFYKENVDIRIYKNLVCMQFSGLYPNLWLDFQRQKIEMKKIRNLDILLDISGVGKTFNILGSGTKQYLIYVHLSINYQNLIRIFSPFIICQY
jgi:hypothetical protein